MEETNTTQSISSGANLLNQLNSFKFDSPLKVDVIFEDSDDEQETKIKIEKISSPNNENHTDTLKIDQPNPVNNTSTSGVITTIKEEHREESRKRKIDDEHSISKMSKTDNGDKVMKEVQPQFEKQNSTLIHQTNPLSNNNDNEDTNTSTSTHIAGYVCNLLKALSRHLILIFESYCKYRKTRSSNNQVLIHNTHQSFLRAKNHFFNLSFCTVANVILPEIRNRSFISQFLTDTIALAKEKNINLNLQSELGPMFAELVSWTKQRKACTEEIVQKSNSLLMQQLLQPPLEIGTKNIIDNQQKNSFDASITFKPISGLDQTQQCHNINKNVNSFSGYSDNTLRVTTRDQTQFVIPTNGQITANHVTSHTNSITSQSQNHSMDINLSKSILFSSGPPENQLSISVAPSVLQALTGEDSVKNTPNMVMNQNKIPLPYQHQNLQQHAQFQKPQMLQQLNVLPHNTPFHLPTYPGNKMNSALVDPRQPKISSHQLIHNHPQQLRQNIQQHIPHPQNYRLHMSQQVAFSNVQNSGHLPTYLANDGVNIDQRQSQIPLYYQQSFQQQEHYQKQMSQQIMKANVEKLDRGITCPTNNLTSASTHPMLLQTHPPASATWQIQRPVLQRPEIEKPPPPYPTETVSFETEFQTFLGTNEIQKQTKGQQEHVVQSNQPLRCDSSKEITRSVSTDSGFMSPLNFETNKDRPANDDSNVPVITHITSLNPGASYIAESNCCICGKATRKMCIGCYKKYYCSSDCQRTDWTSHMQICKRNT